MTATSVAIRAACCSLLAGLTLATAAPAPEPGYEVRETKPRVGSNIRHTVGFSSIPLGRSYAELNASERADVRRASPDLGANDEPPFARDGFRTLPDALARLRIMLRVEGELVLQVQVDAKGEAQSIGVLKSPDANLQKVVGPLLMNTEYQPATCGGTPCAKDLVIAVALRR